MAPACGCSTAGPFFVALDVSELLQDVWGQDWPDHVEDLVDGELRGNEVHQWFPFCRGWFVLCASHQKLACAG